MSMEVYTVDAIASDARLSGRVVWVDKHNCPQCDLIPGPCGLQSGMLPQDHCDLLMKL